MTVPSPEKVVSTELHPGEPEGIFVVGVSRSGTTLMRNILERSERIALAPENHFLGHLLEREGARYYFRHAGDLAHDETMRKIVDMIYSGEFQHRSRWREVSPYWRWLTASVSQEEMERRLVALRAEDRSERGLMGAFMRVYADYHGRPIMGEKTPAHLAYVDTLLEWFPNGRVVHMIRDPRAVYVSDQYRRLTKRRPPYSWLIRIPFALSAVLLVQVTWTWAGAARRDRDFRMRYPDRYRLVRFEDVVTHPDGTLPALFDFLGVAPPPDPTAVKVYAHGFRWGQEGLDSAAASRWRQHIGPFPRRWLTFWLAGYMRRFGYSEGQRKKRAIK